MKRESKEEPVPAGGPEQKKDAKAADKEAKPAPKQSEATATGRQATAGIDGGLAGQEIAGLNGELLLQLGQASTARCLVVFPIQHGLEFDKCAQTGHFVQVNADVVPEIDFPALANHTAHSQGRNQGGLESDWIRNRDQLVATDSGRGLIRPNIKDQRR